MDGFCYRLLEQLCVSKGFCLLESDFVQVNIDGCEETAASKVRVLPKVELRP